MSSLSTLPKGDSAWLLRKSIQRVMQQVSVLETNIGSSTTGNSANTQIIFNDAGTLRGDAQFTWNKTLNRLTVDGDETISGDLTVAANTLKVDSLNSRVGIGTATPYALIHANGTIAAANFDWTPSFTAPTVGLLATSNNSSASIRIATLDSNPTHDPFVNFLTSGGQNWSIGIDNSDSDKFKIALTNGFTGSGEIFAADPSGVFTWSDGAGGTRMTLNSTGLGVGDSPTTKIFAKVTPPGAGQDGMRVSDGTRVIQMSISGSSYSYQGIGANQNVIYASGNPLSILSDAQNLRLGTSATSYVLLDTSGNVLVGTTAAGGSASNSAKSVAGFFSTVNGTTASTASGSAVTMFASPTEATFIVSAYIFGTGAPATYNAVAIVKVSGSTATVTTISSSTNMTISVSGLNVQATQTSGSAQVVVYSAIRIS